MSELKKLYEELYTLLDRIYNSLDELTKKPIDEINQEFKETKEIIEKAFDMYSLVVNKYIEIAEQSKRSILIPDAEDNIRYLIVKMEYLNSLLTKAWNLCKAQEAFILKTFDEKRDRPVYDNALLPIEFVICPNLNTLMETVEKIIKSLKFHYSTSGKIITLKDGKKALLIYQKGKLRAVVELTPTDKLDVWEYHAYGIDLNVNPFMEKGYAEGYENLSEDDYGLFREILEKGTLVRWKIKRRKLSVDKDTIEKKLKEAERKYLMEGESR